MEQTHWIATEEYLGGKPWAQIRCVWRCDQREARPVREISSFRLVTGHIERWKGVDSRRLIVRKSLVQLLETDWLVGRALACQICGNSRLT